MTATDKQLTPGMQLSKAAVAARERITAMQAAWVEAMVGPANFDRVVAAEMAGSTRGRRSAHEWWHHQGCREYMHELLAVRMRHRGRSIDATLELLVALAHSDVTDIMDITPSGLELRTDNLSELPWHVRQAIQSLDVVERKVRVGTDEDGKPAYAVERSVKVKMHNKVDAVRILAQANKLVGDHADQADHDWGGLTIVRSGEGDDSTDTRSKATS